jgi:hypothetical protein
MKTESLQNSSKDMEMQIWGEVIDYPDSEKSVALWKRITGGLRPGLSQSEEFAKEVRETDRYGSLIAGLVTQGTRDAKLALWWKDKELVPAIWCPDLRTAVHVLALPYFMGGKVFAICRWCKQLFCPSRADQVYCEKRHAEAHRVARWRAKMKQKRETKRKASSSGRRQVRKPSRRKTANRRFSTNQGA